MAFKALFMAHAPDADYEKHNHIIDTGNPNKMQIIAF